jgi:hypothetical protein
VDRAAGGCVRRQGAATAEEKELLLACKWIKGGRAGHQDIPGSDIMLRASSPFFLPGRLLPSCFVVVVLLLLLLTLPLVPTSQDSATSQWGRLSIDCCWLNPTTPQSKYRQISLNHHSKDGAAATATRRTAAESS